MPKGAYAFQNKYHYSNSVKRLRTLLNAISSISKSAFIAVFTCAVVTVTFRQTCFAQDNQETIGRWENSVGKSDTDYVVYLVGDAGKRYKNRITGLDILKNQLQSESQKSAVIFLGDNSYPNGLPKSGTKGYQKGVRNLQTQTNVSSLFNGNIFFIPGNHDWDSWSVDGWEAVNREEEFVESQIRESNNFLPDHGCPGPDTIRLASKLMLVLIDSQWWLHQYKKPYGEKSDCHSINEDEFISNLKEIAHKYKDQQILLAGHHPFFSNGNHGGYFGLKDHLFPLTAINRYLYIPLPILGSVYPLLRKLFPHIQDLSHRRYQEFSDRVLDAFKDHDHFIYAAGHEHSLQYFKMNKQHFIVSGSGSKTTFISHNSRAEYASSTQGFSKLIYFRNGAVALEFWEVNQTHKLNATCNFRKTIMTIKP